jgi:membrane-associated protein
VGVISAVVGDQLGYALGRKSGPMIFHREDSLLFKRKNIEAAQNFYARHGARALVLARFVPIFRTFVPFTAGIAHMRYPRFFVVSLLGGLLWTGSLILVGYFLGKTPLADQLHKVILLIVVLSVLPIIIGAIRKWLHSRNQLK